MRMSDKTNQTYSKPIQIIFWGGLVLIVLGSLVWGNYQYATMSPGGTDFLYRWLPTRLVILGEYESPYLEEVEHEVEMVHYGRLYDPNDLESTPTPGIFVYPIYTMLVFAPFSMIEDFTTARALWMTLAQVAHIGIVFLSLKMVKFSPKVGLIFLLCLLVIFDADFIQPLIDGNPSSLAALFAVLSLYFIMIEKDAAAGVFLSLATIKPQFVILFFILVWLWSFSRKRWKIIWYSFGTQVLLLGFSFLVLPSWVSEFLQQLSRYPNVASPSTPKNITAYWFSDPLPSIIGWVFTIGTILIIFMVWKHSYNKGFMVFLWAACITFAVMPLTGITSAKSNYLGMIPGFILFLHYGFQSMSRRDMWRNIFVFAWIILSWVFFYAGRNFYIGETQIYFLDFYPLPLFLIPALLSIRHSIMKQAQ